MFDALELRVFNCQHCRERRISIVSATAAIQIVASNDWGNWTKTFIPSVHPGLFVEMTVKHDLSIKGALRLIYDVDHEWAHAFWLEHLLADAFNVEFGDVFVYALHGLFNESVF